VIRIGLIGVGTGARQLVPALTQHPHVRLTAAADLRQSALDPLRAQFDLETFTSAEAMCDSNTVDAVWVATPNHLHADHAITAAEHGKHVIVSKPMAVSLDEADAMIAAAERNNVVLLAGHTQSMAPVIRRMAEIVRGGELGRLGMLHTWHFTDWMFRPRQPDELDTARGGGPVFRQASHQIDILRTIAGPRLRSVRAATVNLDASRQVPGAYTAYLEFEDATPATIVYSGYGHFDMATFLRGEAPRRGTSLGLFGMTTVACEQGDIRESPRGLFVDTREGSREIHISDEPRGLFELDALYAAVADGTPVQHDGHWGLATLEVCLAIHESSRTRREVVLTRQT
jgi:phthalate 4,5-cis-dihydrodiol dehydrogenase